MSHRRAGTGIFNVTGVGEFLYSLIRKCYGPHEVKDPALWAADDTKNPLIGIKKKKKKNMAGTGIEPKDTQ